MSKFPSASIKPISHSKNCSSVNFFSKFNFVKQAGDARIEVLIIVYCTAKAGEPKSIISKGVIDGTTYNRLVTDTCNESNNTLGSIPNTTVGINKLINI